MEIFKFELGEKLDLHFDVKFNGESDGSTSSPEAQNPHFLDLLILYEPCPYWPPVVNVEVVEKLD